jgi:hypothetical protein
MRIDDPYDLIRIISKVIDEFGRPDLWWRGHSKSEWKLSPAVYRHNRGHSYEMSVALHFERQAPARYTDCPADALHWLFLMQHYGLPTRLLDWTQSPLIALFFTICEERYDPDPAVLWALDPVALNLDQHKMNTILPASSVTQPDLFLRYLAEDAFVINGTKPDVILATFPPHLDTRMMVQQACSTIHGTTKALEELDNKDKFLRKIEIPSDQKPELRRVLQDMLGIRQSTIYPDLEHLARDLASEVYIIRDI